MPFYSQSVLTLDSVALCQLMMDGESKGLFWIVVQLRDKENGHLLPGVSCGDIGAKAGRQGLDNGWIQFSQVSIPQELRRHALTQNTTR
jgi:acyl-CoA oxidase